MINTPMLRGGPRPVARLCAALVLVVTSAVTSASYSAETSTIRRFALVVGTNNGGTDRVQLRYANADAERFARVLRTFGGVQRADLVAIREVTPDGIRAAFERLNRRIAEARGHHRRVELIVYYSGHSDETGLLPSGDRMSWVELRQELKRTPADVRIAILDSCASGSLIRGKGGVKRSPFLLDQSSQVKGHAYLTSSSADEVAQESDRIGASYFTHHLVTGLRGAADVNSDRKVTLSEAYQYAFHRTLERTEKTRKGPQHPNYDFELAGSGDVVITALHEMAATLLFEKALAGRIFIRDVRGRLVAELSKIPGRRIELGLDPGRYKVNLHVDNRMYSADLLLARGKRIPLQSDAFTPVGPLEVTRARGGVTAPPPAAVAERAGGPESMFNLQFLPGLSLFGVKSGSFITKLSVNIIGGINAGVRGVEAAGVFNVATGGVTGGQYAGVFNGVGGMVDGIQFGGVANVTRGMVRGVQVAGAVNITGARLEGAQFSGAVNVAKAGFSGVQAAAVNIAGANSSGAQVGVVNISGNIEGAQVSVVNIGDETQGLQAGVINVADLSRGLQIGVINVAANGDGHAIGLLNFLGNGYNRLEAWTSDTAELNAGVKFGSKWMYTVLTVGMSERDNDRFLQGSIGWGTHVSFGKFYLDADVLSGFALEDTNRMESRVDLLGKARLTVGRYLGRSLAVFGGVALNAAVGFDGRAPRLLRFGSVSSVQINEQTCMSVGPGFFAGLSI